MLHFPPCMRNLLLGFFGGFCCCCWFVVFFLRLSIIGCGSEWKWAMWPPSKNVELAENQPTVWNEPSVFLMNFLWFHNVHRICLTSWTTDRKQKNILSRRYFKIEKYPILSWAQFLDNKNLLFPKVWVFKFNPYLHIQLNFDFSQDLICLIFDSITPLTGIHLSYSCRDADGQIDNDVK